MKAHMTWPSLTRAYAALIAVINAALPEIGKLMVSLLVAEFKCSFQARDKNQYSAFARFIANLTNERVTHENIIVNVLNQLLKESTDDSVEVAIDILKACGQRLGNSSSQDLHAILKNLRSILETVDLHERVKAKTESTINFAENGFQPHIPVADFLMNDAGADQFMHSQMYEDPIDMGKSF